MVDVGWVVGHFGIKTNLRSRPLGLAIKAWLDNAIGPELDQIQSNLINIIVQNHQMCILNPE